MIKTHVFEAVFKGPGQIEEIDLGWVTMPDVPIEKKAPQPPAAGQAPPPPLTIKINGTTHWIIGHTWDLRLTPPDKGGPMADSEATLVLVVQRVPDMPSGLVRAGAETMGQLEKMMPPPGSNGRPS